jgi:hypothetical protein
MRFVYLGLLVALSLPAVACSSDDKGKKDSTTQVEKEGQTSVEISAADGGLVELGKASLDIPGGALDGDTTITVESSEPSSSLPDASSLKGLVYDFGPDGTTFAAPAALTLPSVGDAGEGKEAVIAWLDEESGVWQDLPTTTAGDGSLQADITHFTKFVVRLRGVVTGDCSFNKCGGDIEGTWSLTGLCADVPGGLDPFDGKCPEAVADVNVDASGTITFNGDGTLTKNFTTQVIATLTVPSSCLETLHGTLPASCDELNEEDEDSSTVCTGDPTESCTCVETGSPETDTDPGDYSTTPSGDLTIGDVDSTEPDDQAFCVKGDELRVQGTSDDGVTITYIATRQ